MNYMELARRRRRWTQFQLSRFTHIPIPMISILEKGQGVPTETQRAVIASALGLPPNMILEPVITELDGLAKADHETATA